MVRGRALTIKQEPVSCGRGITPIPTPSRSRMQTRNSMVRPTPVTPSYRMHEMPLNPFPLKNQMIVLDIESTAKQNQLKALIAKMGGATEDFVCEDPLPFLVVSDHQLAKHLERVKVHKNGSVDQQLTKKLPLILKDAVRHKIRVRHADTFEESLLKASKRTYASSVSTPAPRVVGNVRRLKKPFIKIEDQSLAFAPMFKELDENGKNYGQLYFGKFLGVSMFHKATADVQEKRVKELHEEHNERDMSPARKPALRQITKGFCEICGKHFQNLTAHFTSKEHLDIVNAVGFYDEVDALLGSFVDHITCPNIPLLRRPEPPAPRPNNSIDLETYRYSEFRY